MDYENSNNIIKQSNLNSNLLYVKVITIKCVVTSICT